MILKESDYLAAKKDAERKKQAIEDIKARKNEMKTNHQDMKTFQTEFFDCLESYDKQAKENITKLARKERTKHIQIMSERMDALKV